MRLAHDGDVLVYQCCWAAQPTWYDVYFDSTWIKEFRYKKEAAAYVALQPDDKVYQFTIEPRQVVEPEEHVYHLINLQIEEAAKAMKAAGKPVVFLTSNDKSNFRFEVATIKPYKGNRDQPKPVHYEAARDFLQRRWNATVIHGEEADDALAQFQFPHVSNLYDGEDCEQHDVTCIATVDKDLDMIPGWHYNYSTRQKYWVTKDEALKSFYRQLLEGDRVDNIQGVPGIGKVKAAAYIDSLQTEEQMYEECLRLYEGNLAALIENAQLLWMRRYPGEMWEVPK